MEAIVTGILHTSGSMLKIRHKSVWTWTAILGAEVEVAMIPLAIDIYYIVELWIVIRWLDVPGLQNGVDKFVSLCCYFRFQGLWNLRLRPLGLTIHQHLLFLFHAIYLIFPKWIFSLFHPVYAQAPMRGEFTTGLLSSFHLSKQVSVCTADATMKCNSPISHVRQALCTKILPLQGVCKLPGSSCDFSQQSDVRHAADRSVWPREDASFWLL